MPDAKHDDSTDIEAAVKKFAADITTAATKILNDQADKKKKKAAGARPEKSKGPPKPAHDDPPDVAFALDQTKGTTSRTPAEQASYVVKGTSWVCWSAHMADRARHVTMKADGKAITQSRDVGKVFGDTFADFKKAWATAMKSNGLKNAGGADGWFDGDCFHLELPESKIAKTDERAKACLVEYVRLTRVERKPVNPKFEKDYETTLKPYVEAVEKKLKAAKESAQKKQEATRQ